MLLFFLQRNEPGESLWIWLIVILIPLLGRIAGWVLERIGGRPPEGGEAPPGDRQARAEARRERARELERRGQEMWKRLLEGGEAPPEPPPPETPRKSKANQAVPATLVRQAKQAQAPRGTLPHDQLPSTRAVPTLERELVQALPSEAMPEIRELAQHVKSDRQSERDLHADEEISEIGRVDYLEGLRLGTEAGSTALSTAVAGPRTALDWRQAILWSEIIGSPVSLRDGLERDLPAFR